MSDRSEKVIAFNSITGLELDECRKILEEYNWDLEVATQAYLSEGMNTTEYDQFDLNETKTQTKKKKNSKSPNWFKKTFKKLTKKNEKTDLGGFDIQYDNENDFYYTKKVKKEDRNFVDFIPNFNQLYGEKHVEFLKDTTLRSAYETAKADEKMLIVVLLDQSYRSEEFAQDVLLDEKITKIIGEDFLVWGIDRHDDRGWHFASKYSGEITEYPLIVVFSTKPKFPKTILDRIQGEVNLQTFCERISNVSETIKIQLENIKNDQMINKEIDQEFEDVLKQDQEKLLKEKIKQKQIEEEKRKQEEKEKKELLKKQQEIERKRKELPDEPDSTEKNIIMLRVKLPNGNILKRKFLTNWKIRYLYHFVDLNSEGLLDADQYHFATNFPKKEFREKEKTFEEYALENGTLLMSIRD
ncbi:fas-associated protein [Anaeramoeba flamelloides]|uniref:Fas-associated protein n=1 Tax=Anaeramoeba flamelloides TaxID=1746091 RepID=A0ABQ8Y5M5_9EUKA|nr:fas-associated protein [Anaeramoeba flamelloides]